MAIRIAGEEKNMPVTEFLERNARLYPDEVALVELNPDEKDTQRTTWKEYGLIESDRFKPYRRQITWNIFDEKANRFANLLIGRGIKKGDKVAILMYNCLEWLPIYFGVLKSGAIAVPFNFRYDAEEILYCAELAEVDVIVFGSAFIGRLEINAERLSKGRLLIYVGDSCPSFAESYRELAADCSSQRPNVEITEEDFGAIYFSSGTTGFPKAILHKHQSLTQAAEMEQKHHGTSREDTFLCIPPLYHTGAKFHWMGSLVAGPGGAVKGHQARDYSVYGFEGALHHCLASCALGAGHFRRFGQGRAETGRIRTGAVAFDAYRCAAGSPFFNQALEGVFPPA